MKHVVADRISWRRVTARRFRFARVNEADFTGYIALIRIDAVREPLWVPHGSTPVCIVDRGYDWLTHILAGTHYALTTAFDSTGRIVQHYIDICAGQGVDERGIAWFDDLYLDIVFSPAGLCEVLDADELEAALRTGDIAQADYDLAWREAHDLLARIAAGRFALPALAEPHRQLLLAAS